LLVAPSSSPSRAKADPAGVAGGERRRGSAGATSVYSSCSSRRSAGRVGALPGCAVPDRRRRIWIVGLAFALLVLLWSEQSMVLAATTAPNNLEVGRCFFFFLLDFGFSFLSLVGRGGKGRERGCAGLQIWTRRGCSCPCALARRWTVARPVLF
jgi:hypothetical protein